MTTMTGIHDSATCAADHGQPCEQCRLAIEQERRQQAVKNLAADIERGLMTDRAIDATNAELKAYVSVFTLREALADILDEGWQCGKGCDLRHPWAFPTEMFVGDVQPSDGDLQLRQRFMSAVVARAVKLSTMHLENLCHRHRVARLPKPTASVCADCKREQNAARKESL